MNATSLSRLRMVVRVAAITLIAFDASAQTVSLSNGPLYASLQAHPNIVVTASVEFPTVGPAFRNTPYSSSASYVGYFDPTKCYDYDTSTVVTELVAAADPRVTGTTAGTGFFRVSSGNNGTRNPECNGNRFSGNFMNWVTMSAIDEFRYAMTGGNRVAENGPNGGTIIQRAFLPDGSVAGSPSYSSFYADGTWFPRQQTVANVTPQNAGVNVVSCRGLMFLGTNGGGGCYNTLNSSGQPDNNKGTFYVRVLVCDATEGPVRTDLCRQYGGSSGLYKPVGQAQINAANMRFATFGYLMDQSTAGYTVSPSNCVDTATQQGTWNRCRYGGVLRSAMKYIGPTKYDANLVASTNANAEINADGTLNVNPDANAIVSGGQSGFINFINKFGSTGVYKLFDPMGEMYYEAIRYFQGLQPSPEAITFNSSINTAARTFIYDNFPVVTTWTDPIQTTCSANYIINLSDTNTNDDVYYPGYTGTPANTPFRPTSRAVGTDGFNAITWTAAVGVLESTTTPSLISSPADVNPSLANLQNLVTGYHNSSYGPVGAAYWANTNDIRPDLVGKQTVRTLNFDVNEPPSGSSPPAGQSQKRALWLMGKYGYFTNTIDRASDGTQANPFYATDPANPNGAAIRSNSEWEDSPGSGYPSGYLLASSPQKLIDSLRLAFSQIAAQSGTAAGAAITSAALNYGSAGTYISNFKSQRWSGTVLYETVTSTNGVLTVNNTPIWDAGALLTTRCGLISAASTVCTDTDTSTSKRNIVTTINVGGTRQAKPFTFTNISLDTNYLAALNANPSSGLPDAAAQQRINYLRGYRVDENSAFNFRDRDSVMGDIINSAPIYEGAPSSGISDSDYQTFFSNYYNRTAAVYVGANDGMLHAFNALTGAELFAYIPNFVSSYLADLTYGGYIHEPYVDSIPVVREAKVNGNWKTVLVSGAGAGGQGVFALDVTNPNAFDSTKVLFEFTDADDADLGNVVFSPEIVKLQTGTSSGVPTYGYFAAVTAYNNKRPQCRSPGNSSLLTTLLGAVGAAAVPACTSNSQGDVSVTSATNNKGVLFLLSLDRTLGTAWVLGTNYYKYYFPATSLTAANGLGPVSALLSKSGSGAAAALYFGDLQGNLWRFNTAGLQPTWTPSIGSVASPTALFVASPSTNVYQPITARPELGTGPFGSTLISFGTGEYLGSPDLATPYAQQSQYLLIDQNGGTQITRTNLVARTPTLVSGQVTITGTPFSYTSNGTQKGWYMDFLGTSTGERMINKAALAPGLLTFTSLTLAGNICGSGGGYIYQVNPVSGLPISGTVGGYVSTVGIPGPPAIVTLAVSDGVTRGAGENIGQQTQAVLVSGTSGQIAQPGASVTQKAPPNGRVSWREVTNYNDRH